MIHRLYVHNFRCLENFEIDLRGRSSTVLIGKNGTGKSTLMAALRVLQKLARGSNRVRDLLSTADLTRPSRGVVPVRFEVSVEIEAQIFEYVLALELPDDYRELRVREERLAVDRKVVYSREIEKISIAKAPGQKEASFVMDWHNVALPVIHGPGPVSHDSISKLRLWLGQMLLLRPMPSMITGESKDATLQPSETLLDLGAWFTGIMAHSPSAYIGLDRYLKQALPDFDEIQNRVLAGENRAIQVLFRSEEDRIGFDFASLSDGEKCFVAAGLVIAAQSAYGPVFCFWDEPDSYLALSEVGHFIMSLRKSFRDKGQLLATSHNPEAIRHFSNENTFLVERRSHLEPTLLRSVSAFKGDLAGALLTDELSA